MRIGEAGNRGPGQSATCKGFSPQQVLHEQVIKQESRGEGEHQFGMEGDGALPRGSACPPQLHASAPCQPGNANGFTEAVSSRFSKSEQLLQGPPHSSQVDQVPLLPLKT